MTAGAASEPSHDYRGTDDPLAPFAAPLPRPPGRSRHARVRTRDALRRPAPRGRRLRPRGAGPSRRGDLVLAVDELASNSVRHGGGHGVLRLWRDDDALPLRGARPRPDRRTRSSAGATAATTRSAAGACGSRTRSPTSCRCARAPTGRSCASGCAACSRIGCAGVARRRLEPRLRPSGRRPAVLRGVVQDHARPARRARRRQRRRQVDPVPRPRGPAARRRRRRRHRDVRLHAPGRRRRARQRPHRPRAAARGGAGAAARRGRADARAPSASWRRAPTRRARACGSARRSATGPSWAATSSRASGTRPAGGSCAPGSTRSARRDTTQLSGGERKRLVLEVLFASDAAVLLLDEPDNFLDVPAKLALERRIAASKKTIVLISHDRDLLGAATNAILTLEANGDVGPRRLLPHLPRGAREAPAAARRPAGAVEARGAPPVPVLQDHEAAGRDLRRQREARGRRRDALAPLRRRRPAARARQGPADPGPHPGRRLRAHRRRRPRRRDRRASSRRSRTRSTSASGSG